MIGAPAATAVGPAGRTARRTALWASVATLAAIVVVFRDDWSRMAAIWLRSDTFGHGVLVAPIAAWLAWRRRAELAATPLRPSLGALGPLAACGAAWIVADLARVDAAAGFALVGMLACSVCAVCGVALARALAFPLAFLALMVPFGEFLQPALMAATADVTVGTLRLFGIPVFREGLEFVLPTGRWSVVEACSGLRYLIASTVLGVLYAHLMLRTTSRRLLVVASAFCVPIVANWVRAVGIVLLGHASGMTLATGVDHLLYGWLFFGLVMAALFAAWTRLREPPAGASTRSADPSAAGSPGPSGSPGSPRTAGAPALAAVAALCVAIAVAAHAVAAGLEASTVPRPIGPVVAAALPGLVPAERPLGLRTGFEGARERVSGVLEPAGAAGVRVGVELAYYARQHESAEMIGHGHAILPADAAGWRTLGARTGSIADRGAGPAVRELELAAPDDGRILMLQWFTVGGRRTAQPWVAKLLTAAALLRGAGDHSVSSAVWIRLGRAPTERDRAVARQALSAVAGPLAAAIESDPQ